MIKHRSFSRLLTAILIIGFLAAGFQFSLPTASAANASELVAQINGIPGLAASVSGDTVTVGGDANVSRAGLALNIDAPVTVIWQAKLDGAATATNYMLTLSGKGAFVLDGGSLGNSGGAGGTVYINDGVTLDVKNGALIDSPGTGSAVTVGRNVQNAEINVSDYGIIRSTPNGYAINDGGGFDNGTNNTAITVGLFGLVEAGTACAIRSTGSDSVVTVSGGTVQNAASNNLNPAINMNCAPPPAVSDHYNVIIISDGTVRAMNSNGYAIQSSQNVRVVSGTVSAIGGRAISLVGMNSVAKIEGGRVSTVTGDAICTSTTTRSEIVNARIEVVGGVVEAIGSGNALRITGSNNKVLISGGQVLAKNGRAVFAADDVPADTNRITISGGFVFAWGPTGIEGGNNVIAPIGKYTYNDGIVVAWDTSTGIGAEPYHQGDDLHLKTIPENTVPKEIHWDKNPDTSVYLDGIRYGSALQDFFQLNVEVIQNVYTLTIINGIDGASITKQVAAGSAVSITARDDAPILEGIVGPSPDNINYHPTNGDKFFIWESSGGGGFGDDKARDTFFTMPSNDVTITAQYNPRYLLWVEGINGVISDEFRNYYDGTGTGPSRNYGYFAKGEEIVISATFNSSSTFTGWSSILYLGGSESGTIAVPSALITTFTMPGNPRRVTANGGGSTIFSQPPHKTTVIDGKITDTTGGTASFTSLDCTALAGTGLYIEAIEPYPNAIFTGWESSDGGGFTDASSPNTVFVMPNVNTTITATFDHGYTLTVNSGSGSGIYKDNDRIHIVANNAPTGKRFVDWTEDGGIPFAGDNLSSTMFTMPAADIVITANYTDIQYTLEVINGMEDPEPVTAGPQQHSSGVLVTIKADDAPESIHFDGWFVASGEFEFPPAMITSASATFNMPADNVTIIATYSEALVSPDPPFYDPGLPGAPRDSGGGDPTRYPETKLQDGDVSHLLDIDDHIAYVRGIGGGLFAPDKDMTRAEVAQMFYNLLNDKNIQITRTFPDVPNNAWYRQAVGVLASLGIIAGYPDGRFHPEDSITRAEFTVIAVRFTEESIRDGEDESFIDVRETHWAFYDIKAATGYGWIYGTHEGYFEPNRHIIRAEAVTMVNRILLRAADKGFIDSHTGLVAYTDVPKSHWAYYDIVEASYAHEYLIHEDGSEEWR